MKKTALQLFTLTTLMCSLWSCGNRGTVEPPPTADGQNSVLPDGHPDKEDTALLVTGSKEIDKAKAILKKQQDCLADLPENCQTPTQYCTSDSCRAGIVLCHKLSYEEFDALVADGAAGRVRTAQQVYDIINGVNCETTRFRVRYTTLGGLDMDTEEITAGAKLLSTSYYSIALLKGIFDKTPTIFTFYKGVKVDGGKIVPFKVEYANETIGYYDLSDSQP